MLNTISLQGRLVRDIELKTTSNSKSVCNFTIACERNYSKTGEKQTDFIDCASWGKTAEFICKYFKKGSQILVNGSLQTRTYEDKSGIKRKISEILVEQVNFCGDAKSNNSSYQTSKNENQLDVSNEDFAVIDDSEDLPF